MRATLLLGLWVALGCSLSASQEDIDNRFGGGSDTGTDTGRTDGGTDTAVDTGPTGPLPVDSCTRPEDTAGIVILNDLLNEDGEAFLSFDTSEMTNASDVTCSASAGHDGFFAVETQPGEEWHFHLDAIGGDRDPSIYILEEGSGGRCDSRSCEQSSNRCSGSSDEHFLFIPDGATPATWFLGIDDANEGGGEYLLTAVLLSCDGFADQHGEGCDDPADPGCRQCRRVISADADTIREFEPNDNVKEANFVDIPSGEPITVNADLGGLEGCFYPDVFAVNIPEGGGTLRATPINDVTGEPCAAGNVNVRLEILSVTGQSRGTIPLTDDCSVVEEELPSGIHFVEVTDNRIDVGSPLLYDMRFEFTP